MEKLRRIQQPQMPTMARLKPESQSVLSSLWSALVYYVSSLEESVARVLEHIVRQPQLDSVLLERPLGTALTTPVGIALTAGSENLIEHGLGRPIRGWRVNDIRGSATVWRVASPTSAGFDADKHLVLACSTSVTVTLEVY